VPDLLQKVEQIIRSKQLFQRGQSVVVAVSGGVDSMVLLHVLHRLSPKFNWRLVVAHFNHCLRGAASNADEQLVKKTAAHLGLEAVSDGGDVQGHRRAKKISLEMAARALRYQFLGRVTEQMKIRSVALAHHADDQVELFFLRLFRGTGGEGLGGMKWIAPAFFQRHIQLVRPLLGQTKADLLAYAKRERIAFREDASNTSPDILRNRIRREWLPFLTHEYEPGVLTRIVRSMEIIGGEAHYINQVAEGWLANKRHSSFDRLHPAVQRQCLCIQLSRLYVTPEFELVERLRCLPDCRITISPGSAVYRDQAGWLYRQELSADEFNVSETTVDLGPDCGERVFDHVKVVWQIQVAPDQSRRPKKRLGREFFDVDRIGQVIRLRHWREGDRFQPIGMAQEIKLQDLFTNLKIAVTRRRQLVVATTVSGEIFWIEGLRIGERFKLDKATRRRVKWQWTRVA
jgi:tRNA(Ile)-lysidine synthase